MGDDWDVPEERNPVLDERRAVAGKQQQVGDEFVEFHHPIEDDPAMRDILDQADALAEAALKDQHGVFGFCHLVWGAKQEILQSRFGVAWFSPDEMNPNIWFD